eukprot:Gregarina_sp_Poly_1__10466@NODE_761_length_6399_cov_244_304169_g561_i0_p4_GENE_NODE_761_length_6399_cov_244_304169_g561_i0NODE_761_length_6399_cov_244_304169_g561_i0_p4_ORF_typecomplete_len214_score28_40DUF5527/PF17665_1/0_026Orai1/PF07856_12/0_14_NODE_761_length_6399_cov_244_304169_g561_i019062547
MAIIGDVPNPSEDASLVEVAEAVMIIAALIGYFLMLTIEAVLEVHRGRQIRVVNEQRMQTASKVKSYPASQLILLTKSVEARKQNHISLDFDFPSTANSFEPASCPSDSLTSDDYSDWSTPEITVPLPDACPSRLSQPSPTNSPRFCAPVFPECDTCPENNSALWSDEEHLSPLKKHRRRLSRLQILRGLKPGDACGTHNFYPVARIRGHRPV